MQKIVRLIDLPKVPPGCNSILLGTDLKALFGNVTLLAAIVATLVASRLLAIGGDVPRLATVETTAVRILLLHDGLPNLSVGLCGFAIPGDVPFVAAVVARTGSGTLSSTSSSSAAASSSSSASSAAASGRVEGGV